MAAAKSNFQKIAELMERRKVLAQDLSDIEVKLVALHRLENLPYISLGKVQQPKLSAVKAKQHADGRSEAAQLGITYHELRTMRTAERLGLSVEKFHKFRLDQSAKAVKSGMSLTEWRQAEANKAGVGINNVEKELSEVWKKRGSF